MNYAEAYGDLHSSGAQKHFAGYTLKRYKGQIAGMIKETRPRLLLDYGSGKGYQYIERAYHAEWAKYMADSDTRAGVPVCYDIGVRQLRQRCETKDCFATCPMINPKSSKVCTKVGLYDGVFSTDMLEHIERQDLPRTIRDMMTFLTNDDRPTFAFFSVSCIPADKFFPPPDGRNVHVTMEPPEWWMPMLTEQYGRAPGPQLRMKVMFETADGMVTKDWVR